MTVNLALLLAIGILISCGMYLVLQRSLTRILLGTLLLTNGANLFIILMGGDPGRPPILDGDTEPISDPLAQAMVLTAIVIGLGLTAFLLALAYRSLQLTGDDYIHDDLEDRRLVAAVQRQDFFVAEVEGDAVGGSTEDEDTSLDADVAEREIEDETSFTFDTGLPADDEDDRPAADTEVGQR